MSCAGRWAGRCAAARPDRGRRNPERGRHNPERGRRDPERLSQAGGPGELSTGHALNPHAGVDNPVDAGGPGS